MRIINRSREVLDTDTNVIYFSAVISSDGTELIDDLDRAGSVYIREDFIPFLKSAVRDWEKAQVPCSS